MNTVRIGLATAFAGAALSGLTVSAADIYKSMDANGRIAYSDHPLSASAKLIVVRIVHPDVATAQARLTEELAASEHSAKMRRAREDAVRSAQAAKDKVEAARKESCQRARDHYRTFTVPRRVYRWDEQGDRVYYSSQEIDAQRLAAQAEIAQYCE